MNLSPEHRIPFRFTDEQQQVIEAARQRVLAYGLKGPAPDFEREVLDQHRRLCRARLAALTVAVPAGAQAA